MDALYPICPDCLFIGEGTGATSLAANWGEATLQSNFQYNMCVALCNIQLPHSRLDQHGSGRPQPPVPFPEILAGYPSGSPMLQVTAL